MAGRWEWSQLRQHSTSSAAAHQAAAECLLQGSGLRCRPTFICLALLQLINRELNRAQLLEHPRNDLRFLHQLKQAGRRQRRLLDRPTDPMPQNQSASSDRESGRRQAAATASEVAHTNTPPHQIQCSTHPSALKRWSQPVCPTCPCLPAPPGSGTSEGAPLTPAAGASSDTALHGKRGMNCLVGRLWGWVWAYVWAQWRAHCA